MVIDDENKVVELLNKYKQDIKELESKRGFGFPMAEIRNNTEIAFKQMFVDDLEKAIASKKYYWRKKKEHRASFEEQECIYLNFDTSEKRLGVYDIEENRTFQTKFTKQEARDLLKDEFNMFEKVECEQS